jgi:Tfp pilus assembly protein PilF
LQTAQRERAVALAREAEQRKRRQVQLALAAALVALLLGGGAFAWWRNEQAQAGRERDARNAEAVAALLGQAEEALKANDAAKAQVALDAAKKRSAEGGAENAAGRLGRLEADLTLARDLDAVDQFRWTYLENKPPDPAAVAVRTRKALARFGADLETVSVDEAAARLSASVVRERIISALDRLLWQPKKATVRGVLRRMDAHPFRDEVRDAVLANDRAKCKALAGKATALEQPPGFVAFLGESEAIPVERRRQLLAAASSRRPADLGLLMTLGGTYPINREDGATERLRWYQAAVAAGPNNAAAYDSLGIALRDRNDLAGAEAASRKAIALAPNAAGPHNNLGVGLAARGQLDEAIASLRKAIALDPTHAGVHNNLGVALSDKGEVEEAIACYHKAIALDPKLAGVRNNLGLALKDKGQMDKAIACYHKAIALDPKYATAHSNLGLALARKGKVEEGIASCHKAIEIDPKLALAHNNLGRILCGFKRDYDGGIVYLKKAIALDPKYAIAHYNLGTALAAQGKVEEAIASYRKAIAYGPKYADAHCNLGTALVGKGKVEEAIACYHRAIAVQPKHVNAHCNLGFVLYKQKRYAEATEAYRKSIALQPNDPDLYFMLGSVLHAQRKSDEAAAAYREVIRLRPEAPRAHCSLGLTVRDQGNFAEALKLLRRGHEFGTKQPGWPYPSAQWVRETEQLVALEAKLLAFLKGEFQPRDAAERLELVKVCVARKFHYAHAAARLSADAFAADPKLADDLKAGHRYNAACFAALAATGQGEDAARLDAKEKARLGRQALDWLRADLALRTKQLDSGQPRDRRAVQSELRYWQKDSDLAGIRDEAALTSLPAKEREALIQLWADVAALLKKAETTGKQEGKR